MNVCIVEDDDVMGASMVSHLDKLGYVPMWFHSAEEALETREQMIASDVIVCDIRLPQMSGEELFMALRGVAPEIPFILMTAFGDFDQAVRLIKEGLDDYITKPFQLSDLVKKIRLHSRRRQEDRLSKALMSELCERMGEGELVAGISSQMQDIGALIKKIGALPTTIMITGETGTGKEVIANLIHHCGQEGAAKPFVSINCAALPPSLLESELFGHERGAFTGADRRKQGKLELAKGGTLFLDEIGEISEEIQIKLLRVLQERQFERLGSNQLIPLEARLITATNRELKALVGDGHLREDFFYRINVVSIHVPPLRERHKDIIFFARHFTRFFAQELGVQEKRLSPTAEAALLAYDFPGNVRELRNMIERATVLAERDMICPEDLFQPGLKEKDASQVALKDAVAETEKMMIRRWLEETDFSINKTAQHLGISRKTLWEKMKRHGIDASNYTKNG